MDTDECTLQEYLIQLEQVELALRSDPDNEELLKLKVDLEEIIDLTKELVDETKNNKKSDKSTTNWKDGDKCMAIWRVDGKYYSATVDQILEDGTCTVIFDGYSNTEITQVGQLMTRNKNSNAILNNNADSSIQNKANNSQVGHKKAFTKKDFELKLKEAKKRKKEKFVQKLKALDELSEKEKNKWKSFNNKLSSKTWKGVVKKNKFETPSNHESKIGVGTNSLTNRPLSAAGTILPITNTSAAAAAALSNASKSKHGLHSLKTTMYN